MLYSFGQKVGMGSCGSCRLEVEGSSVMEAGTAGVAIGLA